MSSDLELENKTLKQRVELLEQAMKQSARIRQQFNDAEIALKESRSRYRSLIQHAFDAILIISANGDVREANPAACRLFAMSEQELARLNIDQLIPDLNPGSIASKKGQKVCELEGRRKHLSPLPLEITACTLNLENDPCYAVTARDITERKHAEELRQQIQHELEALVARRTSELSKLNAAVQQASEILMITAPDGTIEYLNDAFETITGIPKQEAIGAKPSILRSSHHDNAFFEKMWKTITRGNSWEGRIINKRKDGSLYPALTSISPVFDTSSDQISGYVCISQDISEQEQMEQQMRQSQKMEAIGTLASGIAHEFNNMLAGILGNLYLIKTRAALSPKAAGQLSAAEELSLRAAQMIKQLLTFAHKDSASMKPVNLSLLLKEAYKISSVAIPESTTLKGDFTPEPLTVQGDATQLQQILINLLKNAHDACGESALVSVSLKSFKADRSFREQHPQTIASHFALLQVRDSGCGIPTEDVGKIFEPFYTTKAAGEGTGLGLSMVYGAVQQHNGIIEVESTPGDTCFNIYLPLIEKAEESLHVNRHAIEGGLEKILHVDDDGNIREITSEILTSLNYSVVEACNGAEALEIFMQNPDEFSLVILDVVMPKLGGVEAAKAIRRMRPEIPLLFMTGYGEQQINPDDLDMGSVAVISKPCNIPELSRTIKNILLQ
ncbi:PAS domain S-box-containing protein [Mariprofundus ferrinatatus]|uniref:histidine kinase n=1 Tax=Mariprofundus ferrinatatus TaxID=1921087 RepID=A0A2K8L3H0_9PROT|nr:PAS domain-containing sensor histidine kinase [Mariprofundus ferrinatatus]ATX81875.1 PAS domain S-box-containing protein [Mariprofundus ferrinatatus]